MSLLVGRSGEIHWGVVAFGQGNKIYGCTVAKLADICNKFLKQCYIFQGIVTLGEDKFPQRNFEQEKFARKLRNVIGGAGGRQTLPWFVSEGYDIYGDLSRKPFRMTALQQSSGWGPKELRAAGAGHSHACILRPGHSRCDQ